MAAFPRRAIGLLAAAGVILAIPAVAAAATPHLGIAYDLDGSPAPAPPSLNQLDLYTPDGTDAADSRPVVVYVHGGGWRAGDKSNQLAKKIELFTDAGYVFASVNYRLSPDPIEASYPADRIRFPDHPADVGESLAWIERNIAPYGGDPSRILLIGHSAGAHLVSLVSTDPSFVETYGMDPRHLIGTVPLDTDAFDVSERIANGSAQAKALFYNAFATPAEDATDDSWGQASPINFATPEDPEFLLVTQAAAPGRVQNTREMAAALGQDPMTSAFLAPYDHNGINGAVGSATDTAGETEAIMSFFARMVDASQTSRVEIGKVPKKFKAGKRAKVKVRFRFEAATAAASYECRLDGDGFKPCSSPARYEVGKGGHTFRVRAIASNADRGPVAKAEFRIVKRKR